MSIINKKFNKMNLRFLALDQLLAHSHEFENSPLPNVRISDIFGINVFDLNKMQKYVSKSAYEELVEAIETGTKISRKVADQVAAGMKAWAIERGATHYTHWFQPLTGYTAEKHDSFLDFDKNKRTFENFDGRELVQQEPDASSFPSGGIRNTFEARGYTAWDPSSPAFVIGDTLCIPTIFVSYTGEALDYKTPLLKALQALSQAATDVANYFDSNVKRVIATLGWEQEFFLIDEALYNARPDLVLTGRTLMGHSSAKDQQLNDHYFGAIPERVKRFMQELAIEAYKLGIPLKTRHNEVAPSQFEVAPIFEEANLAVDHNQLLMAIIQEIAKRHKFRVLLHEKPFKGINGSGKHNNWSLMTDTGINLLKPSKDNNLLFLTFLVNVIKTVYDNQDLLRASILTPENAHRLGAHEAPPAIISVFVGKDLTNILEKLEKESSTDSTAQLKKSLNLDLGKIPEILLDNTDRNRTSPFAFTGNRFEFRAVGSSTNCASPMIALNTALAAQLISFKNDVEKLLAEGKDKDSAIIEVLRKYIKHAKPILFEGNNYSEEWIEEAKRRGLTNIREVPEALQAYLSEKTISLFQKTGVLSERELIARYNILIENYILKTQIEARVLGDLAINHIIPIAVKYQNLLLENVSHMKQIFPYEYKELTGNRIEIIKEISLRINEIKRLVNEMVEQRKNANTIDDLTQKAFAYAKNVAPYFDKIRYHIDKLELIVDNSLWTLPKYREILFLR